MRLAIVGTAVATALMIASASAQAPKITGNKAFCLKSGTALECSFDTMAACQKGAQTKTPAGSASCVSRSEAR